MNRLFMMLLTAHSLFFLATGEETSTDASKRVVCYYTGLSSPLFKTPAPEDLDPTLCTHLVYMGVVMDNKTERLVPAQPRTDLYEQGGKGYFNRTANLKERNPHLKILLQVKGPPYMQKMPKTAAGRSTFVESAINLLRNYGFDGLHIDWVPPRLGQREFSELLLELRQEFDKYGFLITTTFPEFDYVVYNDQDLDVIKRCCDFIVITTFDYTEAYINGTSIYAPLESVKSNVEMYLAKDIPADKVLISVPSYGMSYKLKNINETGVGAEIDFEDGGKPMVVMPFYSQIAENLKDGTDNWVVHRDRETNSPYATSNTGLWTSYDDPQSTRMKAEYVVEKNLGGAAIYALNFDDFVGYGGEGRYPLTKALYDVIVRGH